jgi:hypothetical protein
MGKKDGCLKKERDREMNEYFFRIQILDISFFMVASHNNNNNNNNVVIR